MAIELEEVSTFQKLLLQEVLLEAQTISPDQLRQALQELNRRRDERRAGARRLIYLTDLPNYGIVVVDSASHEIVSQIALPRDKLKVQPAFIGGEWIPYGQGGVALFSADNKFLHESNWSVNEQTGLAIGAEDAALINSVLANKPYAAVSQHLTHEIIPTKEMLALPLDLTINQARDRIFVSDRGAGLIHIIDAAGQFVVGSVQVRKEGSRKGIHVAEHPQNRTLFVTDNTTPALTIVDARTQKAMKKPLRFGPLGNLVISPDGLWLYITVLRPDQPLELVILETKTFREKKVLPLEGFPFSLMDDPKDLLLLAPDGKTLMAQTYVNEPSLFTPVINVISTEDGSLVEHMTLGRANKPTSLAWQVDHPELVQDDDRDLAAVLIDLGFTTQEGIDQAIAAAEAPEEFEDVEEEEEEGEEEEEEEEEEEDSDDFYPVLNQYDLDPATLAIFSEKAIRRFLFVPINRVDGIFTVAFVRPNHEEALRIIEGRAEGMPLDEVELSEDEFNHFMKFRYHYILETYLNATRQEVFVPFKLNPPVPEDESGLLEDKIDFMELDAAEVEELLQRFLTAEFYKKTQINLQLYEDARLRLQTGAARARIELETKKETRVFLQYIYIDEDAGTTMDLDEKITQDQLMEMCKSLMVQKGMPAPGEEVKVIDDFTMCPSCRFPMPLGIIQCPHCAYEIIKVEPKEERKIYKGTPPLNANLSLGVVLITDPDRHRVMIIDRQYHVLWHYGPQNFHEVEGSVLKDPAWSIQLPLNRTLICDTGNERVLEIDNGDNRVIREIGRDQSLAQLLLSAPVFATRMENNNTLIVDRAQHRIIEVNMLDQLVWQIGTMMRAGCSNELLNAPRYFQRLASGNNLITDTGNHRVVEIDPANKIVWQYGNRNNVMGGGAGNGPDQLNTPTMANRTTVDTTLICDYGNKRVIEIDSTGKVIWEYTSEGKYGQAVIQQPTAAYQADEEVTLLFGKGQVLAVNREQANVWICNLDSLIQVEEKKSETVLVIKPGGATQDANVSELDERERKLAELALKASKRLKREASKELLPLDLVMVDRTHNQVCIVDRSKRITWQFGAAEKETPESLERPHMATWLPTINRVLVADTERHRVIMVDKDSKKVTWQYGVTDAMGSGPNQLGQPRSAEMLPSKNLLITDPHSNRVIEVTPEKKIVWQYGGWEEGISPLGDPYYACGLENDNRLIVDWRNHRVVEITPEGQVAWQYGTTRQPGAGPNQLSFPEFAQRTKEGTTLICDTRNNRVLEVTPEKKIIWEVKTGAMSDGDTAKRITNPQAAFRMENNNTVIIHSGNRQALELDIEYKPVWSYSLMVLKR